jgi:hypothetical protein
MTLKEKIARLPEKERRGSRPRCLILTEGTPAEVAGRLNGILDGHAMIDSSRCAWMPRGFREPDEAELGKAGDFLSAQEKEAVTSWWLSKRGLAKTPNWDLATRAEIDGREGLVLVEAKAHEGELDASPKRLDRDSNPENHEQIGRAIQEARDALNGILKGWDISRDRHYQLSNRFAWAWKLASLGRPVVLVYLGFLGAEDMRPRGGVPFQDHAHWRETLLAHAKGIVPPDAWGRMLTVWKGSLTALVLAASVAVV